jgi:hypothetical protein
MFLDESHFGEGSRCWRFKSLLEERTLESTSESMYVIPPWIRLDYRSSRHAGPQLNHTYSCRSPSSVPTREGRRRRVCGAAMVLLAATLRHSCSNVTFVSPCSPRVTLQPVDENNISDWRLIFRLVESRKAQFLDPNRLPAQAASWAQIPALFSHTT